MEFLLPGKLLFVVQGGGQEHVCSGQRIKDRLGGRDNEYSQVFQGAIERYFV